jgi:hypothetical protein
MTYVVDLIDRLHRDHARLDELISDSYQSALDRAYLAGRLTEWTYQELCHKLDRMTDYE